MHSDRPRLIAGLAAAIGLSALLFLAKTTGVTYDEPPYLGFAWAYLHGGPGQAAREYPPLPAYVRGAALAAAGASKPLPPPGLVTGPVEPHAFGQLFLFYNAAKADALILAGRSVGALFYAVLLWSVWSLGGPLAAAFAALDPNLLAHFSLATTDGPFAALFLLSLALWARSSVASGAAGGLALGSKATGLMLPFVYAWNGRAAPKETLKAVAAYAAVAALVYLPGGGLLEMVGFRAGQMASPAPTYLFGRAYPQGHPLYFPAVLLMKSTVPLLTLAAWGLRDRKVRAAVLPAGLALLAAAMSGRRQLGVRYVLPLFPLMAVSAGAAVKEMLAKKGRTPALAWGLLAAHAASSLSSLPVPLAYANEAFGGPANARRLMGDSNVDWGQGLPALRAFSDENPGGIILAYFGRDCAARVGLAPQDAFSTPGPCPGGPVLPVDIGREWLAVSVTKAQGFYESGQPAFKWLETRTPAAVGGRSILVYDVSDDAEAHDNLAGMYEATGLPAAAAREKARAAFLRKKESPRR